MRTRTRRSAVITAVATMLLLAGCQPRGDSTARQAATDPPPPVATERAANPTPSDHPEDAAALPSGFVWAGGEDNGLRLGVPADWIEVHPMSDDLATRHGFRFMDPAGAQDPAEYEAHLLAGCGPSPGITTDEQLEATARRALGVQENLVMEGVTIDGVHFVRAEYDAEAPWGVLEHWYSYAFLASGERLCNVMLVTPLQGAEREGIDAIFEMIGPTIEPLDPLA